MNLLLDTHSFIWYVQGSRELSISAQNAIENPQNQCYVSLASLWEMSIKIKLEKLFLQSPFETCLDEDIIDNGFQVLALSFPHLLLNSRLPLHHRDPFDRLLIAQALHEAMPIVSRDVMLDLYLKGQSSIQRIW